MADTSSETSEYSYEEEFQRLEESLKHFTEIHDLIHNKIHDIHEKYDLYSLITAKLPIHPKNDVAQEILTEFQLPSTTTLGAFMAALNKYLIEHHVVNLTTLEIRPNPFLARVFSLRESEPIQYPSLLTSFPELFE